MARQPCTDKDWILGAPVKMRLFELWFGAANRETVPHTVRELEDLVGAKGARLSAVAGPLSAAEVMPQSPAATKTPRRAKAPRSTEA